jgi:hypothetical protein
LPPTNGRTAEHRAGAPRIAKARSGQQGFEKRIVLFAGGHVNKPN